MEEQKIGIVVSYFAKIGVAAIQITDGIISVGDTIRFHGHTTDFTQTVESMQVEHASVQKAEAGSSIGIKVKERVRDRDIVYKVIE